MKFNRTTKSALFTSVVSLFLCFAMLLGTTFAWFTDSATSAGNKIVAGELSVQLLMWNETEYVDISASEAPIFGGAGSLTANKNNLDTLWEPGKTQVAYLAIKNTGSLDLKYEVAVDVTDYTKNLYEVMEYAITPNAQNGAGAPAWTDGTPVNPGHNVATTEDVTLEKGATHYFALSVHMNEDAGNEYQGGTITFDVTVLAAQVNTEADSFGTDYDKNAVFGTQGKAPVVAGASATPIEVRDEENKYKVASFEVPADAIAEGVEEIEANVTKINYNGNFTVVDGEEVISYEVEVVGLREGNTTPVKTMLKAPVGLDPDTVKLYHYDELIVSSYNPNTGYVTFETADYSPFSIVYDPEAKYEAPEVPEDEGGKVKYPTATVTPYTDTEGIEWGNYGQWSPTEGLEANLEAAFTFTCPDYENATEEEKAVIDAYRYWYCDFFVSLNQDLGENQLFLGGNYGSFGWVGFHNGDLTLPAYTEIGLLSAVTTNPWTYNDVEQYVGEFICGVGDVDDALNGAKFTVALRLIDPSKVDTSDSEWWTKLEEGSYIDVNVVTHTFGAGYSIDGNTIGLTNDGDLNDPNYAAWLQGLVDGN